MFPERPVSGGGVRTPLSTVTVTTTTTATTTAASASQCRARRRRSYNVFTHDPRQRHHASAYDIIRETAGYFLRKNNCIRSRIFPTTEVPLNIVFFVVFFF